MSEYPLEIFEVSRPSNESEPFAYVSFGHHDPEAFCDQEVLDYDFAPKDVRYEWWLEDHDDRDAFAYAKASAKCADAKPVTVVYT